MATVEVPQHLAALARGNRIRLESAAVKRELRDGVVSLDEAIHDPRAGCLPVFDLVAAQYGWGPDGTSRLLERLRIRETKRVRELVPRQLAVIVEACDDGRS